MIKKVIGYLIITIICLFLASAVFYKIYTDGWWFVFGFIISGVVAGLFMFGIYLVKK